MNSGRLAGRLVARNIVARRNYTGGNFRPPTMNDLPVPEGDFFAQVAKRHRKYNTVLALGVVSFAATLYIMVQSKLIMFNTAPPKTLD